MTISMCWVAKIYQELMVFVLLVVGNIPVDSETYVVTSLMLRICSSGFVGPFFKYAPTGRVCTCIYIRLIVRACVISGSVVLCNWKKKRELLAPGRPIRALVSDISVTVGWESINLEPSDSKLGSKCCKHVASRCQQCCE
jgi:hypothetical protein